MTCSFASSLLNFVCHLPNPSEASSSASFLQVEFHPSPLKPPHLLLLRHRVNRPPVEKMASPRLIKMFASSIPLNLILRSHASYNDAS